ncbi:hypothetical protein DYB28_005885, partial [Aphanomyces astaci]
MSPTAYERHASKAKDPQDGYPQACLATQQDEAAANHPNLPGKSFLARQFRNLQTTLEPKAKKMATTLTVLLAPGLWQNDERIVINKELRRLVEEKIQETRTQAKASAALGRTIELELKEHEDMPDLDYRNVTSPGGNLPGKRRPTSIHEIEVSDPTKKDEMNTAVNAISILTEGICQPDPALLRLQVEQSNALMALVRATSSTQETTQVQVQALTVSVEEQKGKPDTDLLRELLDNSDDSGDDEDDNDDGRSGESSQRGDDRDNRGRERNGKPHKDASGAGGDPDEPSDDESSEADDIDAPPDSRRHLGANPRPRNPRLKDFKIQPLFDGKEKYPGLGSDFPNWLSIFEDAIATNVAFYNATWSDQHKFYALMQSLTGNAKAFAQDSKAKEPTQSYTIMSARNEFVLECLINNACPSKKNDLTIQLNPRVRNDVAEQHRMVGILTRLTGTGIDFGRRHKTGGKETGQANQAYGGGGNKPGSKQRSGKGGDSTKEKNKNKQDNKPIKPCYLCSEWTHWAKECPLVALGREAKAKAGKTGRANAAKGNQMTTSETRKTAVIEPTATANFIFAESLSFPDDFDSDIVSYLVRGSHVNDAPDAGAMVIRQATTVDDWVCDSGCTHHLTNNPSLLIDAHGSNLRIRIANDDHVMATLKGPAILDLVNGGKIRLNEVHYVPSISANLLSITSLNFN